MCVLTLQKISALYYLVGVFSNSGRFIFSASSTIIFLRLIDVEYSLCMYQTRTIRSATMLYSSLRLRNFDIIHGAKFLRMCWIDCEQILSTWMQGYHLFRRSRPPTCLNACKMTRVDIVSITTIGSFICYHSTLSMYAPGSCVQVVEAKRSGMLTPTCVSYPLTWSSLKSRNVMKQLWASLGSMFSGGSGAAVCCIPMRY